ncbi:hypothetical protein OR1_01687 [Geobacter sp. OR-1]|uniref:type VI secretion system baseplate subunit TssF n=1 Tax=Geobacter sp. OR-1 TaxID=1266765 RepID=UPI0005427F42|nr:type VI secretion system baseplate subunit TssF [Geobacter sp. OR-1]GAM09409.1 hypothetical protein OR1_01687 [Geobacter sp. OR-1]
MDDDFLGYYERELTFVREMGKEFARSYPKIAGRLLLEPDKCEDPHTERLIEGFAFLSARIHKKIDDDFPEIAQSLLNILYPHYTRPIPSLSVVQFEPDIKNIPPSGYRIEKDTPLFSRPVNGIPCQFATTAAVTLWPISIDSVTMGEPKRLIRDAQQAIVVRLKAHNNLTFSQIGCQSLRFFLNGQRQHLFHLYELLGNNVCHLECSFTGSSGLTEVITLDRNALRPVGFDQGEGAFPWPERSSPGHLLLLEYFVFPEKFMFFELSGLDRLSGSGAGDSVEISIYLDRPVGGSLPVDAGTFRLNAAPVINLFKRIAEPIRVEQRKTEYLVIPDLRRIEATEVYSVDRVAAGSLSSGEKVAEYRPFYSLRHHLDEEDEYTKGAFWHMNRRTSGRKGDNGTDLFLSFSDLRYQHAELDAEALTVYLTCSNRDLPERLPFGDRGGDFDLEVAAPVAKICCLLKPTPARRAPLAGAVQWRLISHLSLNYLSIVAGGEDALREILKLYDFDGSPATRQQINGIVGVASRNVTRRIGRSFCRGIETTVTFDEDKFVGAGVYLFASVLERFLGEYVSVNSFSGMIAESVQRKERIAQWPPRNGSRILL